jgi:putative ABC transport system substrate-binding protein
MTVLLITGSVQAQQSAKVPVIGYLGAASLAAIPKRIEAFRNGLRDLGYVEGKNIVIEYRWAEGKLDRLPALAAELVRLNVNVIVTGGPTNTRAAKLATSTIPIVMTNDSDPVGIGFVASLARPGGNITGLATLRAELTGKQLELLKEILPKLSHIAFFGTSTDPADKESLKDTELTARTFGVNVQYVDVISPKDIEPAFRAAAKGRADAVLMLVSGPIANSHRTEFARLAVKTRLPAMYYQSEYVEAGGLMSYGTSVVDLDRRAATYVDKILKGAKPAELPVEQPTKFEFIVNLKAAKQIGLIIPPNVLARADRVIK